MVFEHNQKLYSDNSFQLQCKHSLESDCNTQLSSFIDVPQFMCDQKKPIATGEKIDQVQLEKSHTMESTMEHTVAARKGVGISRDAVVSDFYAEIAPSILPTVCTVADAVISESCKRYSSDGDLYQVVHKRSRQVEHFSGYPNSKTHLLSGDLQKPQPPDSLHGEISPQLQGEIFIVDHNKNIIEKEHSGSEVLIGCPSGSISRVPWDTYIGCEDAIPELPLQLSSSQIIENDYSSKRLSHLEDVILSFLDYFPRKHVALGSDHQVAVPTWRPLGYESADKNINQQLLGTCVLPMPDANSVIVTKIGNSCTDCGCSDQASIKCIRQHVAEARQKLLKSLGHEKFSELGFNDIGEDVALNWSEYEEHVFREVVHANPASLGKFFWNILPQVFPSRSNKELVSYYFNVFMLRKRAEQNRLIPLNVDSDNDEWQGRDDCDLTAEDYEGDSVVESPLYHAVVYDNDDCHDEQENDFHHDKDANIYNFAIDKVEHIHDDTSEGFINSKGRSNTSRQDMGNNSQSMDEHDFQDDSCTSYEGHHSGSESHGLCNQATRSSVSETVHKHLIGECGSASLDVSVDPGYIITPCHSKVWDLSYFSASNKGVDFLPTCNVIEEMLGKGSWDKASDG